MLSSDIHMARFENKNAPIIPVETKIVEAYGLGKCPKLVRQIAGGELDIRINALAVLCDEFLNPYSIEGCAREGAIKVLAKMIRDSDFTTRVRATRALAIAAEDANGLKFILEDEEKVIPFVIEGVDDASELVRENIYEFFLKVTRTQEGVDSVVKHGIIKAFDKALSDETDQLIPRILKVFHNLVGSEKGLVESIDAGVVGFCIDTLRKSISFGQARSPYEADLLMESARTLGYLCYDGRGKLQALEKQAIETLIALLSRNPFPEEVKPAITIALMSITITNEGKKQISETPDGVEAVINLLYNDSKVVIMNALKILSNITVYPPNREAILKHGTCVAKLMRLMNSADKYLAKHAAIAFEAVKWTP